MIPLAVWHWGQATGLARPTWPFAVLRRGVYFLFHNARRALKALVVVVVGSGRTDFQLESPPSNSESGSLRLAWGAASTAGCQSECPGNGTATEVLGPQRRPVPERRLNGTRRRTRYLAEPLSRAPACLAAAPPPLLPLCAARTAVRSGGPITLLLPPPAPRAEPSCE
jgi:hypothetical protein